MEVGKSPRSVSSKRRITYRASEWRVEEVQVCSGAGEVCRAAAVRADGWVLAWAGAGAARLSDAALAVPRGPAGALATPLLGEAAAAAGLARRLAAALQVPVHVCCGADFDRFSLPLVERALLALGRNEPS